MRRGRLDHPVYTDGEMTQLMEAGFLEPDGSPVDLGPDVGLHDHGFDSHEEDA